MMKMLIQTAAFGLLLLACVPKVPAQNTIKPDATPKGSVPQDTFGTPVDDILEREAGSYIHVEHLKTPSQRRTLAYEPIRESDIFWEKRIWRVIDVREKMNLPFAYPEEPLFKILQDAALTGSLPVYSTTDDKFSTRISIDELLTIVTKIDTVITFDPETYEEKEQVVRNDINWADVKRYRLKEIWYFDKETSTMQVRIIGIAPLINVTDNEGNFRYEKALFWVNYQKARPLLALHHPVVVGAMESVSNPSGYRNKSVTWEDLFEMRYFASYIVKESNVLDRRIEDYSQGIDAVWESDRIRNSIFNYEQDMWKN